MYIFQSQYTSLTFCFFPPNLLKDKGEHVLLLSNYGPISNTSKQRNGKLDKKVPLAIFGQDESLVNYYGHTVILHKNS